MKIIIKTPKNIFYFLLILKFYYEKINFKILKIMSLGI